MKITLTLSSKTDERTKKSEILIRFNAGRDIRLRAKSGIFIKPAYWDEETERIKNPSRTLKKSEQKAIAATKTQLDELCNYLITKYTDTDPKLVDKNWLEDTIKKFLFPEDEPTSDMDLFKTLDLFISRQGHITSANTKQWSSGTTVKFNALKSHLKAFDEEIQFEDLTLDKLSEFISFEQDVMNLLDSTVKKRVVYLKWFLRWAVKMGFTANTEFEKFDSGLATQKTKVIFLTEEELNSVISHDFSNNLALDRVRDVYVFCCFTGLRYSDVENLKRSNIFDDKLYITTIKTGDPLIIELNDISRSILKKYEDKVFPNNKALPVISNQKMNAALETMAKECEITTPIEMVHFQKGERMSEIVPKYKLITSHTARKTFVCTAIRLGISPVVIMKITGHKNYNTMKPYIDAEDKVRREAMDRFNQISAAFNKR